MLRWKMGGGSVPRSPVTNPGVTYGPPGLLTTLPSYRGHIPCAPTPCLGNKARRPEAPAR